MNRRNIKLPPAVQIIKDNARMTGEPNSPVSLLRVPVELLTKFLTKTKYYTSRDRLNHLLLAKHTNFCGNKI